ncbi:hypothetical protein ROLI_027800 [Roseobacter fucihabitans]|uniref:Lipoprotein n=1 Tax=Roseobacter fucihabitans TaxID=1537242 RepID=A0ABZ2BUL6_9RHOB|nr:hypothetical protein [Roseobacter litoralis]
MRLSVRNLYLMIVLTGAGLGLSACTPVGVSGGGSVYCDAVLWND